VEASVVVPETVADVAKRFVAVSPVVDALASVV
jgi:hypothetical protein